MARAIPLGKIMQTPDSQALSLWQIVVGGLAALFGAFIGLFTSWRAVGHDKEDIGKLKIDMERAIDTLGDDMTLKFGDAVTAAREQTRKLEVKVHEVEIWNRDNFTTKRSFDIVTGELREGLKSLDRKLDERFDRLDEKLDGLRRA